jgi:hypothetical protein
MFCLVKSQSGEVRLLKTPPVMFQLPGDKVPYDHARQLSPADQDWFVVDLLTDPGLTALLHGLTTLDFANGPDEDGHIIRCLKLLIERTSKAALND